MRRIQKQEMGEVGDKTRLGTSVTANNRVRKDFRRDRNITNITSLRSVN
jgi:hypothetical protein